MSAASVIRATEVLHVTYKSVHLVQIPWMAMAMKQAETALAEAFAITVLEFVLVSPDFLEQDASTKLLSFNAD